MRKTMWQDDCRLELCDRVERLAPDAPARWGKFTAPKMLAHVVDGLRMALGELEVAPKNLPLRYTPVKQLVIYWLPFPKGAPTAPELLSRVVAAEGWTGEVGAFRDAVGRFAAAAGRPSWPDHPAFGRLSERDWGVLVYRHVDHHFTQFGV
jgi:hypothetical protein